MYTNDTYIYIDTTIASSVPRLGGREPPFQNCCLSVIMFRIHMKMLSNNVLRKMNAILPEIKLGQILMYNISSGSTPALNVLRTKLWTAFFDLFWLHKIII